MFEAIAGTDARVGGPWFWLLSNRVGRVAMWWHRQQVGLANFGKAARWRIIMAA